jgi:hypothetical protein
MAAQQQFLKTVLVAVLTWVAPQAWAQSALECSDGSAPREFHVSAEPQAADLKAIPDVALGGAGTLALVNAQQASADGYRLVSIDVDGLTSDGVNAELIAADFEAGTVSFRACSDEGFLVSAVYFNDAGQVTGAPADALSASQEVNYANVTPSSNEAIGVEFNNGGAESALAIISAELTEALAGLEVPRRIAELVLTENITNVFDFAESQAPVFGFAEAGCAVRGRVIVHDQDSACTGQLNPAVTAVTQLDGTSGAVVSENGTLTTNPGQVYVATIAQSGNSREVVFTSRFEDTFPETYSNAPLSPTPLSFAAGENTISGQVAAPRNTRDFVTFTVPEGHELTEIRVDSWQAEGDNIGFVHIDEGTQTVIPAEDTALDFLGGAHISTELFGPTDNLLTALSNAVQGGTGFNAPLGAGDYTFNVQQTGPQESAYTLTFVIEEKAEENPSTTYAVTNSGASAYVIDGQSNPLLELVRGQTYVFDVDAPGHPFWIKDQAVTGTGGAYNDGVSNNGASNGKIEFTVPMDAPDQLVYICQFHGSMLGDFDIVDP